MMKKQFAVALLLVATMVLALTGGALLAAGQAAGLPGAAAFADVPASFWAKAAIDNWGGRGVIAGDGTNFRPHGQITRAEMMVILGRVFGYQATTVNPFADVQPSDWYYDALLKAHAGGLLQGNFDALGNRVARPNDPLTRAEAAALFARVFAVAGDAGSQSKFIDPLPAWAKESIFGMEVAGYIGGKPGGLFDPAGRLTRAEAVAILDNMVKLYVNQPGNYTDDVRGNVVVNTPGAVLRDMRITGNLYLAPGIGEGELRLENMTVTGSTFVRGGGAGRLQTVNSDPGRLVVEKAGPGLDQPAAQQPGPTPVVPEPTLPAPAVPGGGGGGGGGGPSGGSGGGDIGDY